MKLEISELDFYKYVTFNRIIYTIGDAICLKRKSVNNETEFALINSIVYDSVNCFCYLIIEDLLTGPYLDHLTGYLVSENLDSVPKLLKISQLAHMITLNINTIKNEMFQNIKVIVPKYPL